MNTVREATPGVWLLEFEKKEDITVELSKPLLPPMVAACTRGEIVLLAKVPADLRMVEPAISVFWLEAMTRGGLKTKAVGVVTKSLAVKTVVAALGLALKVSGKPLLTKTFNTLDDALAWSKTL